MVIPVGGSIPLQGPPPPEMEAEFLKVKYCLKAMIGSMLAKLAAGTFVFGLVQTLSSCLNLGLNTLLGIFLLRDDASLGKIYTFLMTHCFQSCGPACTGGMGCLFPFVLCNLITVVLDVLLGPTLIILFKEVPLLTKPDQWTSLLEWLVNLVFTVASASALVAQACAAYFGWQAYKVATASMLGSDQPYMPLGGGQQLGGGGGAPAAQGGFRPPGGSYRPPPHRQAPTQQDFKPFSGQGQRLGG